MAWKRGVKVVRDMAKGGRRTNWRSRRQVTNRREGLFTACRMKLFTNILHRFHQNFAPIFTNILHRFAPRFFPILWIKQAAQYLQIVLLLEPAPSVNNRKERQNGWKKHFTNIWLQRPLRHRGWCAECLFFQMLQRMLPFSMWSGNCLVWWMLCNPLIYKLSCWRSCSQLANLCFWHNNLLAQLKPFTNLSPFINNCPPHPPPVQRFL